MLAQETSAPVAACPQTAPTGEQWLWNYHFGTYRPWALVMAILFCTPLFPFAYPVGVLGLWLARREARHTGWPFVPGRLTLMFVLAVGAARNIVALALGTHAGLWILARLLPLLGAPWPVPHVVVHALWLLVHG